MHLEDLKQKTPVQLIAMAEEMEIENVASMRKQELMFAILKTWLKTTSQFSAVG